MLLTKTIWLMPQVRLAPMTHALNQNIIAPLLYLG